MKEEINIRIYLIKNLLHNPSASIPWSRITSSPDEIYEVNFLLRPTPNGLVYSDLFPKRIPKSNFLTNGTDIFIPVIYYVSNIVNVMFHFGD